MTFLANNYNRKKISFKKGIGSYLVATNGKKYLDFCSGIAVNSLGHANPRLVKVLHKQAKKVWHVSNAFTSLGFAWPKLLTAIPEQKSKYFFPSVATK